MIALADLIQELASVQADHIRQRGEAIQRLDDGSRNVTQLRLSVDAEVFDVEAAVVELKSDVDVKRLWLEHHDHICGAHGSH